ncbi:MAG: hypothetical protein ACI3YI_12015 [Bacteroidaceae bacterium]
MNTVNKMANEKRMQAIFGLRHQPERYTTFERAKSALSHYVKPHRIVIVNENPMGLIEGWYIVCPADAEMLHRETEGLITYA